MLLVNSAWAGRPEESTEIIMGEGKKPRVNGLKRPWVQRKIWTLAPKVPVLWRCLKLPFDPPVSKI